MEHVKEISEINGIQNIPWEIDFALSAFKIGKLKQNEAFERIGALVNKHAGLAGNDSRGYNIAKTFMEYVTASNKK